LISAAAANVVLAVACNLPVFLIAASTLVSGRRVKGREAIACAMPRR
jgi:hypothetical protein